MQASPATLLGSLANRQPPRTATAGHYSVLAWPSGSDWISPSRWRRATRSQAETNGTADVIERLPAVWVRNDRFPQMAIAPGRIALHPGMALLAAEHSHRGLATHTSYHSPARQNERHRG